jgi:hypothetical protein
MIHDKLFQWRKNNPCKNYQEYLDSINELPEEDRECAAALWGIRDKADILTIIVAMIHLERWRQICSEPV